MLSTNGNAFTHVIRFFATAAVVFAATEILGSNSNGSLGKPQFKPFFATAKSVEKSMSSVSKTE
jgi:hypothetical protein